MITKEFMLAGNATFTVTNPEGKYYTFKINHPKHNINPKRPIWFIHVLTGPDNNSNYTYLGMILGDHVKLTRASKYTLDSLIYRVADWVVHGILVDGIIPAGYSVEHAGSCGRCGRKLTTPESISLGLGPICAGLS